MKLRTVALINAASGSTDDQRVQRLADLLRARELDWRIFAAQGADLAGLARDAAESEADVVVAGGGDGTVSVVGSALAGSRKILGVLPLGTLNHFAKDLEIPLALDAAVENITAGHVAQIDTGEVNGRIFLNNSSIGLYPKLVLRREKQRRVGHPKWLAMIAALYRTLRQYVVLRVRITADGKRFHRSTPIVFVGNNEYQIEGRDLGGRRCLNGGVLCLYALHNTGPWGMLEFAVRAVLRQAWRIKDFDALQARAILIESRRKRLRVALDGEVADLETPLRYRIRTGALRVIVPKVSQPS